VESRSDDLLGPFLELCLLFLLPGDVEQASLVMKNPAAGIPDRLGIVPDPDH